MSYEQPQSQLEPNSTLKSQLMKSKSFSDFKELAYI